MDSTPGAADLGRLVAGHQVEITLCWRKGHQAKRNELPHQQGSGVQDPFKAAKISVINRWSWSKPESDPNILGKPIGRVRKRSEPLFPIQPRPPCGTRSELLTLFLIQGLRNSLGTAVLA